MKLIHDKTILIVGLGLIGGSYAMALHRNGFRVTAITKVQSDLEYALEKGMIDAGSTAVDPALVGEADLVIFALYPHDLVDWIKSYQHLFSPGTILSDVTGVKCAVVYAVQDSLRADVEFIAAHPMAGRELYGVEHSDDSVFRGANYIVTPTEKNTPAAIALCEQLGRELGFYRISRLTVAEHDDMIAYLSQLTHCIAVTLMNCNDSPHMQAYTGDSFRDLTRVGTLNPEMWSELFSMNAAPLGGVLAELEDNIAALRRLVEAGDQSELAAALAVSTRRKEEYLKTPYAAAKEAAR